MLPPLQGELKNQSTRRNYTNQFKNKKRTWICACDGAV